MAVITTTIAPTAEVFGFSTLEGSILERSNAPRGEVIFSDNTSAITAGGVADSQFLSVVLTLPANFTYVLTDLFFAIIANDITDWDEIAIGTIIQPGQQDFQAWFELVSSGVGTFSAAGGKARHYAYDKVPKALMSANGAANASINVANPSLDGIAGVLKFYARFLQYDVTQHHSVSVNLPTLVR